MRRSMDLPQTLDIKVRQNLKPNICFSPKISQSAVKIVKVQTDKCPTCRQKIPRYKNNLKLTKINLFLLINLHLGTRCLATWNLTYTSAKIATSSATMQDRWRCTREPSTTSSARNARWPWQPRRRLELTQHLLTLSNVRSVEHCSNRRAFLRNTSETRTCSNAHLALR